MKSKHLLATLAAVSVSGCAIFAPYDQEFQCQRSRDYGKCVDVQGAYSEALGGSVEAGAKPTEEKSARRSTSHTQTDEQADSLVASVPDNYNRYKAAEYGELANLIEAPVTPVVAPPKLLRSLVVAYATPQRTLYMPRYVYYFVTEGDFVLGDYLNVEKAQGANTLYPNGAR